MAWFGWKAQDAGFDDASWSGDESLGEGDGFGDEDEGVHTAEQPYCGDVSCWCHTDVEYHDQVTGFVSEADEQQVEQAYAFFGLVRRS